MGDQSQLQPTRLFAKAFVKVQEPPLLEVEPRPDGSIRIVPPNETTFGGATETQTTTREGTSTTTATSTHGGTSSQTSTGTTTSEAIRTPGAWDLGPVELGWNVVDVRMPPPEGIGDRLVPVADLAEPAHFGELVDLALSPPTNVKQSVSDVVRGLSASPPGLKGVFAANDSDSDDDGDTDSESDDDSGGDSDNYSDDDSDVDAVAREGFLIPFKAVGARPPFADD